MPADRCFSVTVLGAAAFAGALLCCFAAALPADLAAGFAAAGFEAVRDLVPALAFAGVGWRRRALPLCRFLGAGRFLGHVALLLPEWRLDTLPARR